FPSWPASATRQRWLPSPSPMAYGGLGKNLTRSVCGEREKVQTCAATDSPVGPGGRTARVAAIFPPPAQGAGPARRWTCWRRGGRRPAAGAGRGVEAVTVWARLGRVIRSPHECWVWLVPGRGGQESRLPAIAKPGRRRIALAIAAGTPEKTRQEE